MTQSNSKALKKAADAPADNLDKVYESLAIRGDLSGLDPVDKARYYGSLCERLGLDPTTQPFLPLKLNGKEILYASRGATDQLARIHSVNRTIVDEKELRGAYIVTVEASLPNGRREQSKGAVPLGNLQGEAFANAIMKAETKAKRRVTLSILGLGMLDETEVDSIPAAARDNVAPFAAPAPAELPPAPATTIGEPLEIEGEVDTSEPTAREKDVVKIMELCSALNSTERDSIKWSSSTLAAFINELYGVTEGLKSLKDTELPEFANELAERLAMLDQDQTAGTDQAA